MVTSSHATLLFIDGCCIYRTAKLFAACDADSSGDPSLTVEDVQQTFDEISDTDSLSEDQLLEWCTCMFNEFTDVEYVQQMEELIDTAIQVAAEAPRREMYEASVANRALRTDCVVHAGQQSCSTRTMLISQA
jgi:hypothetical protein